MPYNDITYDAPLLLTAKTARIKNPMPSRTWGDGAPNVRMILFVSFTVRPLFPLRQELLYYNQSGASSRTRRKFYSFIVTITFPPSSRIILAASME